jgi:hypothetical protein
VDNIQINIEGTTITGSTILGENTGTIVVSNHSGGAKKAFPHYEELASLLEDLEYAEKKVENEEELLKAIRSLESAIKQKDETSIVAAAKKFAKNFTGGVFAGVASGALFKAIEAWIAM